MLIGRFLVSVPQRAYWVRPLNGPSSLCDWYGLHIPLLMCNGQGPNIKSRLTENEPFGCFLKCARDELQ